MGKKKSSFKINYDARTGKFVAVKEAKRRPATNVVEIIKKNSF